MKSKREFDMKEILAKRLELDKLEEQLIALRTKVYNLRREVMKGLRWR
jgi:hypothetical protein